MNCTSFEVRHRWITLGGLASKNATRPPMLARSEEVEPLQTDLRYKQGETIKSHLA